MEKRYKDSFKDLLSMQICKDLRGKLETSLNLFEIIDQEELKEKDIYILNESIKKIIIIENGIIISNEKISLKNIFTDIPEGISIGNFYFSQNGILFPVINREKNKTIMLFYDISEIVLSVSYIRENNVINSDILGNTIKFPEKKFEIEKVHEGGEKLYLCGKDIDIILNRIPGVNWYISVLPDSISDFLFFLFLLLSLAPSIIVFCFMTYNIKKYLKLLEKIALKLNRIAFDNNYKTEIQR